MRALPLRLALVPAALLAAAAPGHAQQSTTATYDDWTLSCTTQAGSPPKKVCVIEQLARRQGQENPISRVIVAPAAEGQPLRLVVQLPVNVWIATGIKVEVGDKGADLAGPFARCLPSGCFAAIAIDQAVVQRFRAATALGKIAYKNGAQQDATVPLSFKGFGQAFDALTKG